ncbi:MAG: fold metallo-hydrolase [Fibrobacteres bacterium]|nr:fold metallo-hydrolase [Fibrobacterota bacterium]
MPFHPSAASPSSVHDRPRRLSRLARILGIISLLAFLFIAPIVIFLYAGPQFGGRPTADQKARFAATGHYRNGRFINQIPTDMSMRPDKMIPMMWHYFTTKVPDKIPDVPLPMMKVDPASVADRDSGIERLTWFGHSACLLETGGRKILFDPMFGDVPAPLPFLTTHRFNKELAIDPERLPRMDAVVISHDHYDHLDYGSILKLESKVDRFLVPLGVGAHLLRWGVEASRITELDWGDSATQAGFTFVCAPARHFSGRALRDASSTLWASWVVKAGAKRIYFSGDSGYGPHFAAIGRAYGPFDLVMMECGQYNEQWPAIHMVAGDAVKAVRELGGRLMLPIHWGAFALSLHSWYDPIRGATAKAGEMGVRITTPEIGEPVYYGTDKVPSEKWWP